MARGSEQEIAEAEQAVRGSQARVDAQREAYGRAQPGTIKARLTWDLWCIYQEGLARRIDRLERLRSSD